MGMDVPAFEKFHTKTGDFRSGKPAKRDFLLVVNESTQNECHEDYHMMFMVDITDETKPFSVSNFYVPEKSGNFCARGGRFGTHSSHEDMGPIYYKKLVFISWFNAGLRVVDIRDPFTPREVAYYIPAITKNTARRCLRVNGVEQLQDRDPDQQCGSRRPRLHLYSRPRQHRHAHPRADGTGAQDREPQVGAPPAEKGREWSRLFLAARTLTCRAPCAWRLRCRPWCAPS